MSQHIDPTPKQTDITSLNSKFSKNDLVFTGLSEIKNYLLTTYGNQIGEYFDFLSVVHTDNSETAMKPHVRWIGYVCKDTGGSSLIFVAHNRYGEDIKLVYSFYDQAWTLNSLSSKLTPTPINLTATVSYSSFSPAVCRYGNVVAGTISIVTTQAVNDLTAFITGFPAPRLNPQLPVWEFGNPSCNKRVSILATGEMQPWWNSDPGLPAGNYVIPIYYIASN